MARGNHDDTHGGHGRDNGYGAPQSPVAAYSPSEEAGKRWWSLPFDTVTNFSLLGLFLGWIMDRNDKRVDMRLNG